MGGLAAAYGSYLASVAQNRSMAVARIYLELLPRLRVAHEDPKVFPEQEADLMVDIVRTATSGGRRCLRLSVAVSAALEQRNRRLDADEKRRSEEAHREGRPFRLDRAAEAEAFRSAMDAFEDWLAFRMRSNALTRGRKHLRRGP